MLDNPADDVPAKFSRRAFALGSSAALTGAWIAANWPGIAAAAAHAAHVASATEPEIFGYLSAAAAADVEALTAHIIPSGATPGAREARAVYFIDRALATFFADRAPAFRAGLAELQKSFRAAYPASASFAGARSAEQLAYLKTVDATPFFETTRVLTIIGTLAATKYGGNRDGLGWKMMGFEDQHVFDPPFGDYDRDYKGFVPYTKERAS
jgi:gluconate 2-dehydrogenase gamma chain